MNVNYGYIDSGNIIAPVAMRSQFNGVGAWHTLTDAERAKHDWYPADVLNEGCNPITQERLGPTITFNGERITVEYTVTDKPLMQIRDELLSKLGKVRYAEEIRNVVCDDSGVTQSPTQSERANVADKIGFLERSPDIDSTPWKDSAGMWHTVTLEDLQTLLSKMRTHVDNAYRAEHEVATLIMAADSVDELIAIDIPQSFADAMTAI